MNTEHGNEHCLCLALSGDRLYHFVCLSRILGEMESSGEPPTTPKRQPTNHKPPCALWMGIRDAGWSRHTGPEQSQPIEHWAMSDERFSLPGEKAANPSGRLTSDHH